MTAPDQDTAAQLQALAKDLRTLVDEVQNVIVGQDAVIQGVITCLLSNGHGLLEGVPGLGKTLLIRTVAEAVSMSFNRIQFTPDLMPADILGTSILVDGEHGSGGRSLQYQPGPIFANIVLADEINRATPKTQSALLEAMAEKQVTAGGQTRPLPKPFFVLATQNPLEQEGTYPLPEAQLDRFLFKINVDFPDEEELIAILDRTTGSKASSVKPVLNGERLVQMQALVRAMPVPPSLTRYVVRILRATHPTDKNATDGVKQYVRFGGSPRGAQSVLLAARVRAAIEGRTSPSVPDVKAVVPQALRHRVLLNFEGEAEGVSTDAVLEEVLAKVKPD
ncbi:MoxR-like ATPase [Enhygromyxa salina]|uniref:MoxR-like ATPase n=1 Tax=Enhygromyxa salina TaxID=215803 RepID=A0A0C2CM70_9BACT|nr:MoxR family ATPase [Enhygromyxa salina]KIG12346.1 MoxR-like ATPase [Enhygromyxa salina]